jgi:subtilisin family serine protease
LDCFANNCFVFTLQNERITLSEVQRGAVWNLDRIDQASLPLNGAYSYSKTGDGVIAYIMDTGIRQTHQEFRGRASCGFSAFPNEGSNPCDDIHGHGTHVAGIIGGKTYGIAKKVNLVSVKVLSSTGEGSWSEIIEGLDWIAGQKLKQPNAPMVINISLSGARSTALNNAIEAVVNAGITVIVAAGNDSADSCLYSPASAQGAIAVGAVDNNDQVTTFSNEGECVSIFAPGNDIMSASPADDTATMSLSGTSMASPHVVGVAALYLEQDPSLTPSQVWSKIQSDSLGNKVLGLEEEIPSNKSVPIGFGGFLSAILNSFLRVPPPSTAPSHNLMLYKSNTV